jgi:hypothetical protein
VARFGMKRGATPRTKAIVSAEIAAKPRGPVSSHFSYSRQARCTSVAKRDTRSRSPYVAATRCATIVKRAQVSYSVELSARTASIRSTQARSMIPRCFIRRLRFSRATNRIGFRCPPASPYSRRCRGSDRKDCVRPRPNRALLRAPSTLPLAIYVDEAALSCVRAHHCVAAAIFGAAKKSNPWTARLLDMRYKAGVPQ